MMDIVLFFQFSDVIDKINVLIMKTIIRSDFNS